MSDTSHKKSCDGKKGIGHQASFGCDTLNLPYAVAIPPADVGDGAGAFRRLPAVAASLGWFRWVGDVGYTGENFASGVQEVLHDGVQVQIVKRSEAHRFKVLPKRWLVERSFARLEKNRRIWKDCERLVNNCL